MFFGRGLSIGRIAGIAISVDYSWFIIFGLFVFLLSTNFFPLFVTNFLPQSVPQQPALYWVMGLITSLLFFASVLAHEMSHALVARRSGIPIHRITLFLLGGVAQMEDEPQSPWDEFKMAIAGPLASVGIGLLFFGLTLAAFYLNSGLLLASFFYLGFINVILAVFNLLPGFPLDGGRVFRALLWRVTGSLQRATQIASITGQAFGWAFVAWGIASIFLPLYGSIWLALVGWFLVSAARSSYQQLVLRETLSHVPIRDIMNPQVEAVPANLAVDHLVSDYFLRESASTLPVEDADGRVLGMVSVEDVRKVPREQWASTLVREIIPPVTDEQVLRPDADAWDAANRMAQRNVDRVLVAEDGHVEGVVTRGAIARWLQTHTRFAPGHA